MQLRGTDKSRGLRLPDTDEEARRIVKEREAEREEATTTAEPMVAEDNLRLSVGVRETLQASAPFYFAW